MCFASGNIYPTCWFKFLLSCEGSVFDPLGINPDVCSHLNSTWESFLSLLSPTFESTSGTKREKSSSARGVAGVLSLLLNIFFFSLKPFYKQLIVRGLGNWREFFQPWQLQWRTVQLILGTSLKARYPENFSSCWGTWPYHDLEYIYLSVGLIEKLL